MCVWGWGDEMRGNENLDQRRGGIQNRIVVVVVVAVVM